jgi:polyphosphate kinase 2
MSATKKVKKPTVNESSTEPTGELKGKDYEQELRRLHVELVKLQQWVVHKGLKACIVFEGRDGAGKGGTIKAITERVSPRVFRVVALPAPTEREKSQMYVQRYIRHMPAAGEIAIFDRSWYNRAGVERVMGFCSEEQVTRFLQLAPAIEKTVVESGIILLKYWLEVSQEEQTRRLEARIDDGRKIWKLSPMDLKSYGRWYDYSRARDEMFEATDTPWAPWYVIRSDDKRRARLNAITHLLKHIPHEELPREKIIARTTEAARLSGAGLSVQVRSRADVAIRLTAALLTLVCLAACNGVQTVIEPSLARHDDEWRQRQAEPDTQAIMQGMEQARQRAEQLVRTGR